jgi:hypothetical protein
MNKFCKVSVPNPTCCGGLVYITLLGYGTSMPKNGTSGPKNGTSVPKNGTSVPKYGISVPKYGTDNPFFLSLCFLTQI